MASHAFGPFPHSLQTEALVSPLGIESASIVAQVQANFAAVENEQHIELAGPRVTEDVGQYFLSDPKKICFPFRRKILLFALQGELRLNSCASGCFLDQIFQRLAQLFLLQRLWAERLHGTPRLAQTFAGEVACLI